MDEFKQTQRQGRMQLNIICYNEVMDHIRNSLHEKFIKNNESSENQNINSAVLSQDGTTFNLLIPPEFIRFETYWRIMPKSELDMLFSALLKWMTPPFEVSKFKEVNDSKAKLLLPAWSNYSNIILEMLCKVCACETLMNFRNTIMYICEYSMFSLLFTRQEIENSALCQKWLNLVELLMSNQNLMIKQIIVKKLLGNLESKTSRPHDIELCSYMLVNQSFDFSVEKDKFLLISIFNYISKNRKVNYNYLKIILLNSLDKRFSEFLLKNKILDSNTKMIKGDLDIDYAIVLKYHSILLNNTVFNKLLSKLIKAYNNSKPSKLSFDMGKADTSMALFLFCFEEICNNEDLTVKSSVLEDLVKLILTSFDYTSNTLKYADIKVFQGLLQAKKKYKQWKKLAKSLLQPERIVKDLKKLIKHGSNQENSTTILSSYHSLQKLSYLLKMFSIENIEDSDWLSRFDSEVLNVWYQDLKEVMFQFSDELYDTEIQVLSTQALLSYEHKTFRISTDIAKITTGFVQVKPQNKILLQLSYVVSKICSKLNMQQSLLTEIACIEDSRCKSNLFNIVVSGLKASLSIVDFCYAEFKNNVLFKVKVKETSIYLKALCCSFANNNHTIAEGDVDNMENKIKEIIVYACCIGAYTALPILLRLLHIINKRFGWEWSNILSVCLNSAPKKDIFGENLQTIEFCSHQFATLKQTQAMDGIDFDRICTNLVKSIEKLNSVEHRSRKKIKKKGNLVSDSLGAPHLLRVRLVLAFITLDTQYKKSYSSAVKDLVNEYLTASVDSQKMGDVYRNLGLLGCSPAIIHRGDFEPLIKHTEFIAEHFSRLKKKDMRLECLKHASETFLNILQSTMSLRINQIILRFCLKHIKIGGEINSLLILVNQIDEKTLCFLSNTEIVSLWEICKDQNCTSLGEKVLLNHKLSGVTNIIKLDENLTWLENSETLCLAYLVSASNEESYFNIILKYVLHAFKSSGTFKTALCEFFSQSANLKSLETDLLGEQSRHFKHNENLLQKVIALLSPFCIEINTPADGYIFIISCLFHFGFQNLETSSSASVRCLKSLHMNVVKQNSKYIFLLHEKNINKPYIEKFYEDIFQYCGSSRSLLQECLTYTFCRSFIVNPSIDNISECVLQVLVNGTSDTKLINAILQAYDGKSVETLVNFLDSVISGNPDVFVAICRGICSFHDVGSLKEKKTKEIVFDKIKRLIVMNFSAFTDKALLLINEFRKVDQVQASKIYESCYMINHTQLNTITNKFMFDFLVNPDIKYNLLSDFYFHDKRDEISKYELAIEVAKDLQCPNSFISYFRNRALKYLIDSHEKLKNSSELLNVWLVLEQQDFFVNSNTKVLELFVSRFILTFSDKVSFTDLNALKLFSIVLTKIEFSKYSVELNSLKNDILYLVIAKYFHELNDDKLCESRTLETNKIMFRLYGMLELKKYIFSEELLFQMIEHLARKNKDFQAQYEKCINKVLPENLQSLKSLLLLPTFFQEDTEHNTDTKDRLKEQLRCLVDKTAKLLSTTQGTMFYRILKITKILSFISKKGLNCFCAAFYSAYENITFTEKQREFISQVFSGTDIALDKSIKIKIYIQDASKKPSQKLCYNELIILRAKLETNKSEEDLKCWNLFSESLQWHDFKNENILYKRELEEVLEERGVVG